MDYAVRFVDNFIDTFTNPTTCEIYNNKYMSEDYINILKNLVDKHMILYNHNIENKIHCNIMKNDTCNIDDIYNIFQIPKIPETHPVWISDYFKHVNKIEHEKIEIRYYCTISQCMYISVFGINPQNGKRIDDFVRNKLKDLYPDRYNCMKSFSDVHQNGTKYLSLV